MQEQDLSDHAAEPLPAFPTAVQLRSRVSMPTVGFGTFRLRGTDAVSAVTAALRAGTRLIDTASIYKNYAEFQQAIVASGVRRSDIFITSKVSPYEHGRERASAAIEACLEGLGTHRLTRFSAVLLGEL